MTELTNEELGEIIGKYKQEDGRKDYDFEKEAMMAQLILEVRRVAKKMPASKTAWGGPR